MSVRQRTRRGQLAQAEVFRPQRAGDERAVRRLLAAQRHRARREIGGRAGVEVRAVERNAIDEAQRHRLAAGAQRLGIGGERCEVDGAGAFHPDQRRIVERGIGRPLRRPGPDVVKRSHTGRILCHGQARARHGDRLVLEVPECRRRRSAVGAAAVGEAEIACGIEPERAALVGGDRRSAQQCGSRHRDGDPDDPDRERISGVQTTKDTRARRTDSDIACIPEPLSTIFPPEQSAAMTDYRFIDRLTRNPAAERRALVAGLTAARATLSPKYFYDSVGCALFGAICELPEYYPTRTERAIFERASRGDRGGGRCRAAIRRPRRRRLLARPRRWLPFLAPSRYVAVDIAGDAIVARARAPRAGISRPRADRHRRRFLPRARPPRRPAGSADGVLLSGLVDRQFRARRRAALPGRHPPALPAGAPAAAC